jgi:DNA-binding GntR family transcriptional regulator
MISRVTGGVVCDGISQRFEDLPMTRRKTQLRIVPKAEAAKTPRRNRVNLFELAYQRLEDLLVNCALRPGRFLTMQDLQDLTGLGRTPIHHAVNRLAADTLIVIKPRHGLQIAPIDLARERMLLQLRRDVERFVVRLAAERSGPAHRNQMLHMERVLRDKRATLTLAQFNDIDRKMDKLILAAASEPFLENTLRPLHTIFRRIGYIHHAHIPGQADLAGTISHHLAVLTAVANRHVEDAVAASDALVKFMDGMFDVMEAEIDPGLLDCSLEPMLVDGV